MVGSRLTRWILVMGLTACSSDPRIPGPLDTTAKGSATTAATGGAGGNPSGSSGGADSAGAGVGGSSSGRGGAVEGDAATPDAGTIDAPAVIHDDSAGPAPCAGDRAALGTNRLQAMGATPMPFATAYNAELDVLHGPGPLLIVLAGVNDASPAAWIGSFGALDPGQGAGVGFAGQRADVPFTMSATRAIQIAPVDANFELKFAPPASDALVPIGSVELSGTLSAGCGSLVVTRAKFLVPATAGGIIFHGSTIGDLMGPASETYRGQAASAWPLEVAGTATEVYAPGVIDDGGA